MQAKQLIMNTLVRRHGKRLIGMSTIAIATWISSALAAVPQLLTQQGRLIDKAGAPVDADVNFVFSIYDAATGGTAVWTETQTTTVDAGFFSARLGEKTAFAANLFDGTKTLYLGVKVGDDAEMTPRQMLTSVPFAVTAGYAVQAANATTADTAKKAKAVELHHDNITKADDAVTGGHASICLGAISTSFVNCQVAANRKCTSVGASGGWLVGESADGSARSIICIK